MLFRNIQLDSSSLHFLLRWLLPFIGHIGICTSAGVIRDFAGPYFVSVSTATDRCLHMTFFCLTHGYIYFLTISACNLRAMPLKGTCYNHTLNRIT